MSLFKKYIEDREKRLLADHIREMAKNARRISFDELDDLCEDEEISLSSKNYVKLNGEKWSIDDLEKSEFRNLSSETWKTNANYISHPIRKSNFIEKNKYTSYLLHEILNDVQIYILDHFGVSSLTIGVVSNRSFNGDLGLSIPVIKLNPSAKLNISVSKEYLVHGTGYEKSKVASNSIWITNFPDIITAVEHNAKSFERIENIDSSFIASMGLDLKVTNINGEGNQSNKLSLYISYSQ